MKTCLIHGLLILKRISVLNCLSRSSAGGPSLALLLKYSVFKVDSYGTKFPPLLHFIKKYKVPWILKWQYDMDGDVLTRRWYVKWWDKFPHIQAIVNIVTREFPSPNALPIVKVNTPMQIVDAPASTSAKIVKPSAKPRKKGSPLDEIRKVPNAMYALLKMIAKEKDDVDSEDERSSEASITKNPYYP